MKVDHSGLKVFENLRFIGVGSIDGGRPDQLRSRQTLFDKIQNHLSSPIENALINLQNFVFTVAFHTHAQFCASQGRLGRFSLSR